MLLLVSSVVACAAKRQTPEDMVRLATPPVFERLQEAAISLNSGNLSNAQSLYQEVIEELLARNAVKENSPDKRKKNTDKENEEILNSDHLSTAYTGLGVIDQQSGNYSSARENFDAALKIKQDNIAAQEGIALLTLNEGDTAEAKKRLLEIVEKTPDAPRWRTFNALGVIADLEGKYAPAVTYYQKAIDAGGSGDQVLNNQAYSHLMAGNNKQALEIFTQAKLRYPDSVRINSNLALTMARMGQYNEARKTWTRHLSAEEAWNNAGYVAMINGDLKTARKYFKKAIDVAPRYFPAAEQNLEQLKQLEGKR